MSSAAVSPSTLEQLKREIKAEVKEEVKAEVREEMEAKYGERIAELEQRVDEQPTLEYRDDGEREFRDLWLDDTPLGLLMDNTRKRAKTTEETVEELKRESGGVVSAEVDLELTRMERYHLLNQQGENPTESAYDDRALTIYEHFLDWSKKTPKGRVLQTGDVGLQTLMKSVRPDDSVLHDWNTVYRSCIRLAEESEGKIRWDDDANRLVAPEPSELKYAPGHRHASSVDT